MVCPRCNAPIEEDTVFCGNCGNQVAPLNARGSTVVETTERLPERKQSNGQDRSFAPQSLPTEIATSQPWPYVPPPIKADKGNFSSLPPRQEQGNFSPPPLTSATPYPPSRPSRGFNIRQAMFIAFIIVLLIIGITAGSLALLRINANNSTRKPPATAAPVVASASGLVSFTDSQNGGHTGALKIIINGLKPPPAGSQYDAWLVNEANEQTVPLGTLTADGQAFTLNFKGDNNGTNLLGAGDMIKVTQEQGNVTLPTGTVVLTGKFPPLAFIHIRHLLFSFPTTPGKIGLLVGTRETARLLNAEALLLKNAANNGNEAATRCAAQSIVNLAEGRQGAHMQALPGFCSTLNITAVGDGFGLLGNNGYVALAQAHASLAATQPDSTPNIKTHAGHVEICMQNVKGWVTTVDQDALALLNNPGDMGKVQEIVTLADHALNGVDTNGDESVDPVPGEGGAITGYVHGQLMAALPLAPQ